MVRNLIPWRKKIKTNMPMFEGDFDTNADRLFNSLFFSPYDHLQKGKRLPSINVINGENKITVEAELPGVNSKDIDISLSGRRLFIKAERIDEKKEEKRDFHRMEISYGSYWRSIDLPADVEQSTVDAKYKNGVLKVELKKTKASQTKKIEIK